jgi:thiaminase (transcriptional activator TenA)
MSTLAERLWVDSRPTAAACHAHPFVQGLADGTLPRPAFAVYVAQDAFFLRGFRRAYALALAKTTDDGLAERLHGFLGGVFTELRLHAQYAAEWGIDLAAVRPLPATRAYTDFLLATAWQADVGETLAAMAPCMRLYAFLGAELSDRRDQAGEYADWIATYASPEFQQLADDVDAALNAAGGEEGALRAAYRYAMACEHRFFDTPLEEVA